LLKAVLSGDVNRGCGDATCFFVDDGSATTSFILGDGGAAMRPGAIVLHVDRVGKEEETSLFFFGVVRLGTSRAHPRAERKQPCALVVWPDLMDVVSCRVLIERHAMRGIERTDPSEDAQQCPIFYE
jgi:hypothetical protein